MVIDFVFDGLLVTGFGLVHSILAALRLKQIVHARTGIDAMLWRMVYSFCSVFYILVAAALWRPVDISVWNLSGFPAVIVSAIGVASWLWYFQIHLVEYDVGLAFGSTAVISALLGRETPKIKLWRVGLRRWIRFPVHTAFFPMFFATPHMSLSGLILAVGVNFYNIVGTVLYDIRLTKLGGDLYLEYRKVTGNFLPCRTRPQGARNLLMARPTHWKNPASYLPAFLVGAIGGLGYWYILGSVSKDLTHLLAAWGVSLVVGIIAGALLGLMPANRIPNDGYPETDAEYQERQCSAATQAAVVSAVSLVTWTGVAYLNLGFIRHLPAVLPMWITTLWFGHVALFFTSHLLEKPGRLELGHESPGATRVHKLDCIQG